jgi:DNA mismatch repair protein MutS2
VEEKEKDLQKLLKENDRLRKEMEQVMNREKHQQQVEILKQQNKVSEDRLVYLKDTERKLRQMVIEWKKEENKDKVVKQMAALLFNKKNDEKVVSKKQKQIDLKYQEVVGEIKPGDKVKMKRNQQVGEVLELRGKRAVVKIGLLPMQFDLADLVIVKEKENAENNTK